MNNIRKQKRSKKAVRGVLRRAPHIKSAPQKSKPKLEQKERGSQLYITDLERVAEVDEVAPASTATDTYQDYLHGRNEVEDLASRVCALASVPATPHYFEDGDNFLVDYGDDDYCSDDEVDYGDECDVNSNSLLLASRTSNIMSNYEDFLSGIGDTNGASSADDSDMRRYSDNVDNENTTDSEVVFGTPENEPPSYRVFGTPVKEDASRQINLHEIPLGDGSHRESVDLFSGQKKGYHYHHLTSYKKFIWGVLGLMSICIAVGLAIGMSLNRSKEKHIGDQITPEVIGLNKHPSQETIRGHTFEEFDMAEANNHIGEQTSPHGVIGLAPQETTIQDHYSSGEIGEANDQSAETKEAIATTTTIATRIATAATSTISTTEGSTTAKEVTDETKAEINYITTEVESVAYTSTHESVLTAKPIEIPETHWSEQSKNLDYASVIEKYAPSRFNRGWGWDGKSYTDAITFCASQDSMALCPYEAICPLGEGRPPIDGYVSTDHSWAAMLDMPNGWVQLGSNEKESCIRYDSLSKHPPLWGLTSGALSIDGSTDDVTPYIVCCNEVDDMYDTTETTSSVAVATTIFEQVVLDQRHPVWFTREHGYQGTSHGESSAFCASMGMDLCPVDAYCPYGAPGPGTEPESEKKLFLQKKPFESEQWAPIKPEYGKVNRWVSLGTHPHTCLTYEQAHGRSPEWGMDGSWPEMKEHILCCHDPQFLAKERKVQKEFNPIWIEFASNGWKGGSYDDANNFCEGFMNRKLCPYEAYCPHGPSRPVIGGHATDFNTEGEQWAPLYHGPDKWVMIGQKYQNVATTCLMESELPMPDWGNVTEDRQANLKKHILCCSY